MVRGFYFSFVFLLVLLVLPAGSAFIYCNCYDIPCYIDDYYCSDYMV